MDIFPKSVWGLKWYNSSNNFRCLRRGSICVLCFSRDEDNLDNCHVSWVCRKLGTILNQKASPDSVWPAPPTWT